MPALQLYSWVSRQANDATSLRKSLIALLAVTPCLHFELYLLYVRHLYLGLRIRDFYFWLWVSVSVSDPYAKTA